MKSQSTAAVLAFFFGGFGIHRFYLGQAGLGIAYLLFCWTLVPAFIGLVDCIIFLSYSSSKFDLKYNYGKKVIANSNSQIIGLYEQKKFSEIINLLQFKEITDVENCKILAKSYFHVGQYQTGRSYFNRALSLTSLKDEVYEEYGLTEFNYGFYKNTIRLLQKIDQEEIVFQMRKLQIYTIPKLLGKSFLKVGNPEMAIEALKKAPINSKNVNMELLEIIVLIGSSYEKMGQKKKAISFFNKALANKYSEKLHQRVKRLEQE